MKRALLLIISVSTTLISIAQNSTISGVLTESGANQPIPGAHIYIPSLKKGTVSDGKGNFILDEVPVGSYELTITSLGFKKEVQTIAVHSGADLQLEFQLQENFIEIPGVVVERTSLSGGHLGIQEIPGSVHYLGPAELEKFNYSDINRILRTVPGVNIQEEEGFGLRPNIGLRGSGVERSSKITIMEDGVLMAPAPYAAPAAYYFPTAGRMQGVEVRKGSSQIKYGPYTTGGAINFISTQIPSQFAGKLSMLGGNYGTRTVHAALGNSYKNFGFSLETYQSHSDGFKELDNGGDTGYDLQDYIAKVRINTNPDAKLPQSLTIKLGQTNGESDETYLGLTDADFQATPYRRYAGSQKDVINTRQRQLMLRHQIQPFKFMDITTTLYRTDFERNWYKLDKVKASTDGDRVSISQILADPDTYQQEFDIITGASSINDDAMEVKANNREYYSKGLQTVFGFRFGKDNIKSDLEVGLRFHQDQIDRFQWVDKFQMQDGTMMLTKAGIPGTESNRIETANAFAGYLQYNLQIGDWTIVPGLRYENIEIERLDYGKEDPDRIGDDLSTRSNKVDVVIPGVGVDYKISETWNAFMGIHKGFSPPGSKEGTEPEESVNYELGFRYQKNALFIQSVLFFNDYSNLLGADLAASGGQGTTDQFNGGNVDVSGIEFELHYDLLATAETALSLPVGVTYTLTEGEFQNSFESEFEGWGTVEEGDHLPYLPKHQLALFVALESGKFSVNLSSKYQSALRTVPGQGDIPIHESTDSQFVFDFSTNYSFHKNITLFGSLKNLTDQVYNVARRPAGLRPGMPRAFMIGLKAHF
jgi:Fe(3+) dicitrate transport protein